MKNREEVLDERKEASLRAAMDQGIVDVVQASNSGGVSIETLELATRLTKKHAPRLCEEHEERRRAQRK